MVQNLNNNLITAPELAELRKRLRNLETKVRLHRKSRFQRGLTGTGWPSILRSTISVLVPQCRCNLLLVSPRTGLRASVQSPADIVGDTLALISCCSPNMDSAELEMTVNMLIQIDKLVQLLESPVFTCQSCSLGGLKILIFPRFTITAPRTGKIPPSLQMSLRGAHAAPSVLCFCSTEEPLEQRQRYRLPSHRPTNVCCSLLLSLSAEEHRG